MTTIENNQGYSSKGSAEMEIKYNDFAKKIDTCNNHILSDFYQMPDVKKIPGSDQIPDREQKGPKFSISEIKDNFIIEDHTMPDREQMNSKYQKPNSDQKRPKCNKKLGLNELYDLSGINVNNYVPQFY